MSVEENIQIRKAVDEIWQFILDGEKLTIDANKYYEYLVARLKKERPDLFMEKETTSVFKPMTNEESRKFGNELMKFGKHKGKRVDEVPEDYLEWLDAQPDFRMDLRRYLCSERVVHEETVANSQQKESFEDLDTPF